MTGDAAPRRRGCKAGSVDLVDALLALVER
jgi:hypothetical protein